jgi:kynurenine formamidase
MNALKCERAAAAALLCAAALLGSSCREAAAPSNAPAGVAAASPSPAAGAGDPFAGTLVDLSHPYDAQTIYWPTAEEFKLNKVAEGVTPQGYYYAANTFSTAEHGGTHIDAPVHFAEGHHTVDQIPLEQLIGQGVVVDVTAQCATNADYQINVADFERWEREHGELPRGAIVLLRTGYGKLWPDRKKYLGTDERGEAAVAKLHFPGLAPDAARWLASNRSIKAVGLDTASIDYGQSTQFESHRALFDKNIPALENLAPLDALPASGFHVVALPMKIGGGSGGPVRAVAFVTRR